MKRFFKSNLLKAALVFSLISVGIELLRGLISNRFDFSYWSFYEDLVHTGLYGLTTAFTSAIISYSIAGSMKLNKLGVSLLKVVLFSSIVFSFDFLVTVIFYWVYAIPDMKFDFYIFVRGIPGYIYLGVLQFFVFLHFKNIETVHSD
jgi:hypothetical protein